jgi:hypothetical protein
VVVKCLSEDLRVGCVAEDGEPWAVSMRMKKVGHLPRVQSRSQTFVPLARHKPRNGSTELLFSRTNT